MKILCFEIKYVGFQPYEWKKLALGGWETKIAAIKKYREELTTKKNGMPGLREAKDAVEAYAAKHGKPC